MRRLLLVVAIIAILVVPLFFLPFPETKAISDLTPFTPHEVKVLVVSPADIHYSGAHYLVADLARYGFNITHHASNDAIATNYLIDAKTSNLDQYDVVILHGILGFPPSMVSTEEVAHFTSYGGILILMGNALLRNETSGDWWGFDSEPIQGIEQRLGVSFTGFLGEGGAWHNSGTFTLTNSSIKGLPSSLSYVTEHYGSISYQLDLATSGASAIYDFTIASSPSTHLVGKTTKGVTYYRTANGAVGICVQGAYIYGVGSGTEISYFGLTDISKRSSLLASLIALAVNRDVDTIIKPQPLASIRLDDVSQDFPSTYLNVSLSNFDSALDVYNITPTIGFIDFLEFRPDYWQTVASEVLSQFKGKYRDWEYSTNLRYYTDPRLMTKEQIETLIDNIKGNYLQLGMDLFSTVIAPNGRWNRSTLEAMASRNLYLIGILATDTYYSDWWCLRVNSSVIVHNGAQMLPERVWPGPYLAENFTQSGLDKNSIHYKYFSRRGNFALATVNGFASFVYYVPNFRWNEVGTYSLRMVYENLTSEIPDIRFVPLIEAGLYFGNKWMRIENASRTDSVIEFDVDTSAIPTVTNIEKGMLWLRINTNESIQEVSIDNDPWFYFDDNSIRMPAPESSSHVRVTLGTSQSPRVDTTRYKVVEARYDGYRLNVSISCVQDLNVSASLFLPKVGTFKTGNWSLFIPEARAGYKFDAQSCLLEFWAISDGFVTLEVGIFFSIMPTPPWYNSSVTITVNTTVFQIDVQEVILSYSISDEWINVTMRLEDGLYVAEIPMMPYGTFVEYRVFVSDTAERWLVSFLSYNVEDWDPPEIDVPTWNPQSPNADEPVSVSVSVTEPENASGVDYVVLWYYLDDITGLANAKSMNMTQENGEWSAVIPSRTDGNVFKLFVEAHDKAGNLGHTPHYTVAGVSDLTFQIVLLGVALVVGTGTALYVYFTKFKKSNLTHETRREKKTSAREWEH